MTIEFVWNKKTYFLVSAGISFISNTAFVAGIAGFSGKRGDETVTWQIPLIDAELAKKEFRLAIQMRGGDNAYFDLTKYQATETPATE